jgi:arylsulfatase A-like enzyme
LRSLLLAGALLIGVRAVGLVAHFCSRDPNGNAIAASPANSLLIALPYHGAVVLTVVAALLLLWKIARPARAIITIAGIALCLAMIILGQIDLGMQWFIGQRFSPMVFDTYIGGHLFSSDLYAPVLFHPVYLAFALTLMLGPGLALAWNRRRLRHGTSAIAPGWKSIAALFALAALCRIPIQLAYGHQLDVFRPPELLFAYHWLHPSEVPVPPDEPHAFAQLRATIDPTETSRWLDPQFPVVRAAPAARNRFLDAGRAAPRPDIVIFAVESLRGAEVGYVPGNYAPGEPTPTPRLDALARERGVVFSRYISNGNPSPRGFFAINGGVWDHRGSFIISSATGTEFDALPARLRRDGYFTLGMWGANPSFDNQLFWGNKWFERTRYPDAAGHFVITKPLADDVLVDEFIAEIAAHDRAQSDRPFFAYVATGSTHEPYTIEGVTHLPPEAVRAIAAEKDTRRRYRLTLQHLDAQLGRALDFLATRHSGRSLVVIVTGDHSDVAGDVVPPEMRGLPNNAVEWTAALVAGPAALVGPPRVETFPASHVDLTPTLLDLAGDRDPTDSMGTNLFADLPEAQRFAVSISGQGYRLDRDGWSLFVRRDRPEVIWTMPAFAPIASVRPGLDGSPFTTADARQLWESLNTWSYLIEHDRVWRDSVLQAGASEATGLSTKKSAGP